MVMICAFTLTVIRDCTYYLHVGSDLVPRELKRFSLSTPNLSLSSSTYGSPTMSFNTRWLYWTIRPCIYRGVPIILPPTRVLFQPSGYTIRTMNALCATNTATTTASHPEHEHLFRYTSGRWLWDEEQHLHGRYKAFNVTELQNLAAKAIGADRCVSITKLAEGGFNKVFRLLMHGGKSVLARIPNPNAGPSFYTTASEVATMEFVS